MAIELQGFRPVYENKVYSRQGQFQSVGVEEIVLLLRYTVPTEEDVVSCLKTIAKDVRVNPRLVSPAGRQIGAGSPLEAAIKDLPDAIIRDIVRGEKECITFIKNNTGAVHLKEGEEPDSYVDIYYGIIPLEIMASQDESEVKRDYIWFRNMFKNSRLLEIGMGEAFNFEMRYSYQGIAIDKNDLPVLLKHRTSSSRSFKFFGNYSHEAVERVVNSVYANLVSYDSIALLPDNSQKILNAAAFDSVKALHELVVMNALKKREASKVRPKLIMN